MIRRPLHRSDHNQNRIIKALRDAGVKVEVIGEPVDLATLYRGVIRMIEVKNGDKPPSERKLQPSQTKFLGEWESGPVFKVETVGEALGVHGIEIQG